MLLDQRNCSISPCRIKFSGRPIYANYFSASNFLFYFLIRQVLNVVTYRLKNDFNFLMKRKVFPIFFNLPVRITAPYVDIINVQDFDNKFAKIEAI